MDRKAVIVLLIKIFPLYLAILYLWQIVGLSQYYHEAIALLLERLYALLNPLGPVKGIDVEGKEFLVKLLVANRKTTLHATAEDITSNMGMLLSLYLASPMRAFLRRFSVSLLLSVAALYAVHVATTAAHIQYACMNNQAILRFYPPGALSLKIAPAYVDFYIRFGMYLFVLALWLPYIMSVLMSSKTKMQGRS